MEADKVTVLNTDGGVITHVNFRQTYETTPLVFLLATDDGSDPANLRIKNVTQTGFDVYSSETDGTDGSHDSMIAVPYIAIEEGTHALPDGTTIVAEQISTNSFQSRRLSGSSWESISLSGFTSRPIVLSQIQSTNSERTDLTVPDAPSQPWLATTVRSVSTTGFQLALERAETTAGTILNEDVAYLAIESGLNGGNHYFASNAKGKIEYETIRSGSIIRGWSNSTAGYVVNFSKSYSDPIAVAMQNTRDGNNGGWLRRRNITSNSISLVVDEDTSFDADRSHIDEIAGILLFSEPFDAEFIYTGQAELIINELMYNEIVTGSANEEFLELYVTQAGNLKGLVVSDQDTHSYRFSALSVSAGDYVILHTGIGSDSSTGNQHHFYQNSSTIFNNDRDDVVLLKPSNDVVAMADDEYFNAVPMDYISYGANSVGGNVDAIPSTMKSLSLVWDYNFAAELGGASDGQSIALTPNGTDSNKAGCWELTASGNASDNGCSGYTITTDTNADTTLTYSLGVNNNTQIPNIVLEKSSSTIYDPINLTNNPKSIPGAMVEYRISARNQGLGSTDNNTISLVDAIPSNMKLCVTTVGECKEVSFVDGTPSSHLSLGTVEYSNNNGVDFSHSPVADAEGFDASITNIRVKLNGSFEKSDGLNHPTFSIELIMGIL
jgi:hypothetical protein